MCFKNPGNVALTPQRICRDNLALRRLEPNLHDTAPRVILFKVDYPVGQLYDNVHQTKTETASMVGRPFFEISGDDILLHIWDAWPVICNLY